MSIKKTLQSDEWQDTLKREAEAGNEDAIAILDYMRKWRWMPENRRKERTRIPLSTYKPDTEV